MTSEHGDSNRDREDGAGSENGAPQWTGSSLAGTADHVAKEGGVDVAAVVAAGRNKGPFSAGVGRSGTVVASYSAAVTGSVNSTLSGARPDGIDSSKRSQSLPVDSSDVSPFSGDAVSSVGALPAPLSSGSDASTKDVIDSALLSALTDPRERIGLLRLEQTLVSFMKELTTGYIEVGGAYNSVVIGGQSGGALSTGLKPSGNESEGDIADGSDDAAGTGVPLTSIGTWQQNERGGRQTSFQRLCLHRLADRFNIRRESPSASLDADGNYHKSVGYHHYHSHYNQNLIRLVKVKDSHIPSKLLIDLDVSAYVNSRSESRYQPRGSLRGGDQIPDDPTNAAVQGLTEGFSSSTTLDPSPMPGVANAKGRATPKKIMKRSSSGVSSGRGSATGGGPRNSGRSGLKGKKMSDKEKAYAEARARIFNDGTAGEDPQTFPVQNSGASVCPPPGQLFGGGGTGMGSSIHASPSSTPPPSSLPSPPSSETGTAPSVDDTVQNLESTSVGTTDAGVDGEQPPHQQPPQSRQMTGRDRCFDRSASLPAAATGGGVSKVTWRNRRQEESDPDFRRARGSMRSGHGNVFYVGGSGGGHGFMASPMSGPQSMFGAPISAPGGYNPYVAAPPPVMGPMGGPNPNQFAQQFGPDPYIVSMGGAQMQASLGGSKNQNLYQQHQNMYVSPHGADQYNPNNVRVSGRSGSQYNNMGGYEGGFMQGGPQQMMSAGSPIFYPGHVPEASHYFMQQAYPPSHQMGSGYNSHGGEGRRHSYHFSQQHQQPTPSSQHGFLDGSDHGSSHGHHIEPGWQQGAQYSVLNDTMQHPSSSDDVPSGEPSDHAARNPTPTTQTPSNDCKNDSSSDGRTGGGGVSDNPATTSCENPGTIAEGTTSQNTS